jgi:CDGSH-type Zn-finger protein
MTKPLIAYDDPIIVELEPGTYHWCQCGRSKEQPFCDGSHEGCGIEPLEFAITEKKRYAMCACKHTGNPPFCDNAHRTKVMLLDQGRYSWCSCGRSQKQPWCDGSHEGTEYKPLVFHVDVPRRCAVCDCKHTAEPPFCDNTHRTIQD